MDLKDVENLAELGKIELSHGEKENLISDMESILAYIKQIEDVDLPAEMEVEYQHVNIWREDIERDAPDFSRDLIMSQFPDSQDDFLKVKKIL
ncbi:MAG: Asp-tRNA(Asn)/Glu-tRNA(Gln) amidotransferase subunit GatC [bacterium]|nr:Asp-tRNA(Asn)/Glu-tRNA(Gln) amidotransferase subunit GatC [bacterium]